MPPGCSFRLQAGVFVLAGLLLAGCARAAYDTHDDFTVATEVKIALLEDRDLGAMRINAAAARGVVTLSGAVRNQADVDHAIRIARNVHGVRDVKSELKVSVQLPGAGNQ